MRPVPCRVAVAEPWPFRRAMIHHVGGGAGALYSALCAFILVGPPDRAAHAHPLFSRERGRTLSSSLRARLTQSLRHSARHKMHVDNALKGFSDLVGDRMPLSSAPLFATESASWAPASPWFAGHNASAVFPVCEQGPGKCDAARETTRAVQAALWASQNPADCVNARYLVLEKTWPAGFGSAVHVHVGMLALAIR